MITPHSENDFFGERGERSKSSRSTTFKTNVLNMIVFLGKLETLSWIVVLPGRRDE